MNKTKTIATFIPPTLRAWLAITLLVIVSSFEVIKVIHVDHHHDNEITVCTESDEANACHRSIVHLDAEAGCAHTQHLEKIVASCEICDALIVTYLFEVNPEVLTPQKTNAPQKSKPVLEIFHSALLDFPSLRGPPACS